MIELKLTEEQAEDVRLALKIAIMKNEEWEAAADDAESWEHYSALGKRLRELERRIYFEAATKGKTRHG